MYPSKNPVGLFFTSDLSEIVNAFINMNFAPLTKMQLCKLCVLKDSTAISGFCTVGLQRKWLSRESDLYTFTQEGAEAVDELIQENETVVYIQPLDS